MKECKGCKETLPISDYYLRKIGIPYTLCKTCYLLDKKRRDLARTHSGTEKECNACHRVLGVDKFSKNRLGIPGMA